MPEATNEGEMMGEAVVAITGASGARYGVRPVSYTHLRAHET